MKYVNKYSKAVLLLYINLAFQSNNYKHILTHARGFNMRDYVTNNGCENMGRAEYIKI